MPNSADRVRRALETWPPIAALPLRDLHSSEPARLRLWAACDFIEMVARLIVVLGIAELTATRGGRLPPELLRELYDKIEEPTLGAWQSMAEAIARHAKNDKAPLFKELPVLVERLGRLLRGGVDRAQQHEENALVAVRNAYAHGGAVTERRAAALLDLWQPKIDRLVEDAGWLSEVELLVRRSDGAVERIVGADCVASPVTPEPAGMPQRPGASAVRRGNRLLLLDPLIVFDVPRLEAEGDAPEGEPAVQAYARRGPVRLLFTPFGSESVVQSLGAEALTDMFEKLFDIEAIRRGAEQRGWVRGFDEDIKREARRVVGRAEESDRLWEAAATTHQGALWADGPAGIGKSALMARLAQQLTAEAEERENRADQQKWLVSAYRFRAGDDRCRRDLFLKFILERLEAWQGLAAEPAESAKERRGKDELQQVHLLLARVKPNRVIVLTDGLDEIDRLDHRIVDDVMPQLRGEGVLLICAGRREPRLLALRDRLGASQPLPDGVPKMTAQDIRAQLFARLGRASAKLIRQDRDAADATVVNRFVDQVAGNAKGLPIYAKLVIDDILAERLRILDARDASGLPKSLEEYYEALIKRHDLDDVFSIRGFVAATLTLAREALTPEMLAALVRRQGYALDPATGAMKVEAVLATLGDMVVPADTPERTKGYELYHDSLRQHLKESENFRDTLTTMRGVLLRGAAQPQGDAATHYLYRNGIAHMIDADPKHAAAEAAHVLAGFDYQLHRLAALAATGGDGGIRADWTRINDGISKGGGSLEDVPRAWRHFWTTDGTLFEAGEGRDAACELLERVLEYAPDTIVGSSYSYPPKQ